MAELHIFQSVVSNAAKRLVDTHDLAIEMSPTWLGKKRAGIYYKVTAGPALIKRLKT